MPNPKIKVPTFASRGWMGGSTKDIEYFTMKTSPQSGFVSIAQISNVVFHSAQMIDNHYNTRNATAAELNTIGGTNN